MNFVHHLTNFRRLVCGCMDSYDSEPSHILQHFSRSTRKTDFCTVYISKFQRKNVQIFAGMKMKFHFSFAFFDEFCDFSAKSLTHKEYCRELAQPSPAQPQRPVFCIFSKFGISYFFKIPYAVFFKIQNNGIQPTPAQPSPALPSLAHPWLAQPSPAQPSPAQPAHVAKPKQK